MSPPSITAVVPEPGAPRVRRGIIAPPTDALLAASDAHTPSMIPVPNFSGVFEILFAVFHEMSDAIMAPAPGTAPTAVPITDERSIVGTRPFVSLHVRYDPEILAAFLGATSPDDSTSLKTSEMANRPIIAQDVQPHHEEQKAEDHADEPLHQALAHQVARDGEAEDPEAKYSAGPKVSEKLALGANATMRTSVPNTPPTVDETIETPSALPACPFLHMG